MLFVVDLREVCRVVVIATVSLSYAGFALFIFSAPYSFLYTRVGDREIIGLIVCVTVHNLLFVTLTYSVELIAYLAVCF